MKFIYGTKNQSKIGHMNHILKGMHIEIEGLPDVEEPDESGETILENAKLKAQHYYNILKKPVFSCDSGLFFEGVLDEEQPGKLIRRVNGKRLNDEEMIAYYSGLAEKYGGQLVARYYNAISVVLNEDFVISSDDISLSSEPFLLVSKPHTNWKEGFPLDALSVEIASNQYYEDSKAYHFEGTSLDRGFQDFFKKILTPKVQMTFEGFGIVHLELYPFVAPDTVRNFIQLIQKGYYLNKSICRSVQGRLIQSGDTELTTENWTDDTPGYILNGEFNREDFYNPLSFEEGVIGMAMASNRKTNYATAGSFFIMLKEESTLDEIVPSFGRVVEGIEVIRRINQLETHRDYGYDALYQPVAITNIVVELGGVCYDEPTKISHHVLDCEHSQT